MKPTPAQVDCNGCTLCCRGSTIKLFPMYGDDSTRYELESNSNILKHKPNGECVYLGTCGCTIHDRAPMVCQAFNCAEEARNMGYTIARKRVKQKLSSREKLNKGFEMAGMKVRV